MNSKVAGHLEIIESTEESDEWGTPPILLEEGRTKLKCKIDFDYAGSNQLHIHKNYCNKFVDALEMEWTQDGFLNAPYSKQFKFMAYAYSQYLENNFNLLILCYAKIETNWFNIIYDHDNLKFRKGVEFYPIKGRVNFLDTNGVIPLWCKVCAEMKDLPEENQKIRIYYTPGEEPFCPQCGNDKKFKKNTSPYSACWIVFRKQNVIIFNVKKLIKKIMKKKVIGKKKKI